MVGNSSIKVMNPFNSEVACAIIYLTTDADIEFSLNDDLSIKFVVTQWKHKVTQVKPLFLSKADKNSVKDSIHVFTVPLLNDMEKEHDINNPLMFFKSQLENYSLQTIENLIVFSTDLVQSDSQEFNFALLSSSLK